MAEATEKLGEAFVLTEAAEQGVTVEQAQSALAALSAEELLLLDRNADQFRHYINKKAKRLKREAQQKASITSEGASQS